MELQYRMYGLVPYNLSPIQKGIQFGHAVVEYMRDCYKSEYPGVLNPCEKWADNDKTFIILNGGTTNNTSGKLGTLNKHVHWLLDNDFICSHFSEPDLGDQLTAVVFLVDERVYDRVKYPDFKSWIIRRTG